MPTRTQSNITLVNGSDIWFFNAILKEKSDTKEIKDISVYNFRRNGNPVQDENVPMEIVDKALNCKLWR